MPTILVNWEKYQHSFDLLSSILPYDKFSNSHWVILKAEFLFTQNKLKNPTFLLILN